MWYSDFNRWSDSVWGRERLILTSCNSHSIPFLPSILFPSSALNTDLQAPTMCLQKHSFQWVLIINSGLIYLALQAQRSNLIYLFLKISLVRISILKTPHSLCFVLWTSLQAHFQPIVLIIHFHEDMSNWQGLTLWPLPPHPSPPLDVCVLSMESAFTEKLQSNIRLPVLEERS